MLKREVANTSHLLRARSNFIQVYNVHVMDVAILSLRHQAEGDFCCSCWQASTEPYITPVLVKNIDLPET